MVHEYPGRGPLKRDDVVVGPTQMTDTLTNKSTFSRHIPSYQAVESSDQRSYKLLPSSIPTTTDEKYHAALGQNQRPQLPTRMASNVASSNLPLPAATPQGLIPPADTQASPQGQPTQVPDGQISHQTAKAFVNTNIRKIRSMIMVAGAANLQVKNLTPEEKEQMRGFLSNTQTLEFIARIDRLAPVMLMITKDEKRTIEFLRLV
jgi:Mediator complex subunit 15